MVDEQNTESVAETEIVSEDTPLTRAAAVQAMTNEIVYELGQVHMHRCEPDRAKRTAALALKAQMLMAEFLADAEGRAKGMKHNVEFIESEVYFDQKNLSDKKLSEAALQQFVAKDKAVVKAKSNMIEAEVEFKKWVSIFAVLKEAHIFFRNIGNGKNEWSV